MVNFRDTKSSTAEVLYPETADLFAKAESSAVFEVYDLLLIEANENELTVGTPYESPTTKAPSPNGQKRKADGTMAGLMPPRPVYLN